MDPMFSPKLSQMNRLIWRTFADLATAIAVAVALTGFKVTCADDPRSPVFAEAPPTPSSPTPATVPESPAIASPAAPSEPPATDAPTPAASETETSDPDSPPQSRDPENQDRPEEGGRDRVVGPGESFRLKPGRSVRDLRVLMGKATVDGTVEGDLVIVGGRATVNGTVSGSISCAGGRLTLGPKAVVRGDVAGFGHLEKRSGATILGKVALKRSPAWRDVVGQSPSEWLSRMDPRSQLFFTDHVFKARPLSFQLVWPWAILVGIVLTHVLVLALFPRPIARAAELIAERPATTLLLGFVGMPLALVMALVVSGITGCLGTPFVALAAGLGIVMGKVAIELQLGRRLLSIVGADARETSSEFESKTGARSSLWTAYALGAGLLVMGYLIPYLGFGIWALVTLWGMGAILLMLAHRRGPVRPELAYATVASASVPPTTVAPGWTVPTAARSPLDVATSFTSPVAESQGETSLSMIAPTTFSATDSGGTIPTTNQPSVNTPSSNPPLIPPTGPTGPTPPPPGASDLERELWALPRAGLGIRLLALLIDLLAFGMFTALMPHWLDRIDYAKPIALVAYFAGFWVWKGASVGGLLMGIRIIRLDGRPIDWPVAIVRSLASFLSLFSAGLGQFWCAWDVDQQTWQDKLAGTVIVKEERLRSLI